MTLNQTLRLAQKAESKLVGLLRFDPDPLAAIKTAKRKAYAQHI